MQKELFFMENKMIKVGQSNIMDNYVETGDILSDMGLSH